MNRGSLALIAALIVARAPASVTITIDRLDPGDGGAQPPPGIIVVDVLVDVSPSDCWTAGGMVAFTQNWARFRYATDPNTGSVLLTNPGTANRFVTFLSKPRPRDANSRFSSGGAAAAGRMYGSGPTPTATPIEINVAYFASPPETSGSPSVDGAVFRVALDVRGICDASSAAVFFAGDVLPPGYIPILISQGYMGIDPGTLAATFDVPSLVGVSWGVYIPYEAPDCPGDVDCDSVVGLSDLTILLGAFGACDNQSQGRYLPRADIDGDGCVDVSDLTLLLSAFGGTCN